MEGLPSSQMCGHLEYSSQSWSPKDVCPIQVSSDGGRYIFRPLTLTATGSNFVKMTKILLKFFKDSLLFEARLILKGIIYSEIRILSLFTDPRVIPSLYEHKNVCVFCPYSVSQWGPMLFWTHCLDKSRNIQHISFCI